MQISLQRVQFIPKTLVPGVLYVAEQFGAAAHLCPCGCGARVSTPLGPTDWVLEEQDGGPSLRPSVGNWQLPCRSHYWILAGEIVWAEQWSTQRIEAGRRAEEARSKAYYAALDRERSKMLPRLWRWLVRLFKR